MIQQQTLPFTYLFIIYILISGIPIITFSYDLLDEEKIKQDLQHITQSEYINHNQKNIIMFLQSALHFIAESKLSNDKIQEYQQIMDNFPYITLQLREKYDQINNQKTSISINSNLSIHDLKQKIFQINNQLLNLSTQLQKENNQIHLIHESLKLLPQQKIAIKNILNNITQQQNVFFHHINMPLENAKLIALQAEQTANRLKMTELELSQLSVNNRLELAKLRIILLKKQYDNLDNLLQTLRNQLHYTYHENTHQTIIYTEKIFEEQHYPLPQSIKKQLQNNYDLSSILTQQTHHLRNISLKKKEVESNILQVQQTLSDLIEQSQWISKSPSLGETLRSQVTKLPKLPKFQELDNEMAQLRAKRLQYEDHMNKLNTFLIHSKQDNGLSLTTFQKNILIKQLNIQQELLTLLLNSYDIRILELTKLKLSYEQLQEILEKIQQATHRYLFWVADIYPVTITYPIAVYQDICKLLFNPPIYKKLLSVFNIIIAHQQIFIFIIFFIIILFKLFFFLQKHYYIFLKESSKYIGKVNQDNFLITFYNILISICISSPIPILWLIIGHNFKQTWKYPIIISIGNSMYATFFILWAFIISGYFASPNGLFLNHFGWSKNKIQTVFSKHYPYLVIIITSLTIALIIFNNYNNREFSNTLGRLCFILLCICLVYLTHKIKQSGLSLLYLHKYDSSNNLINRFVWNVMITAPIISAICCTFGYLSTSQTLLIKLETSLFIWIIFLIIYHIIRRWMMIQRRRMAFNQAKKKRAAQLILRSKHKSNIAHSLIPKEQLFFNTHNKKNLDLDTISSRSLQLTRSLITLIALLCMTIIWAELKFAFSFLENITLWDVTSTIKGIENIQPITLNTFLTIIGVIIITTIIVRNLPAFLELTLLQYLHLNPGTGYAITTLAKYVFILLSSLVGLSLIGIEWGKIQWLIAALGVGLGFGLQEIFANCISGLIILFEKPIRIGDTITIQNITGNVTQINTRATLITDWDNKEIVIPNKEFITKQFTNWSLSNTITRITLRIPSPLQIETKEMTNIFTKIIKNTSLALNIPNPEIYLINLQQGLPIFEIRVYTANIKSRLPLCHQINTEIMNYYKSNGIKLPYLPPCCHLYKEEPHLPNNIICNNENHFNKFKN